ncbi:hypothetical protein [Amycolatopsis sp. lyj-23]|uniref:hypothetical protein n=1 Tax=Amycolatopsis sp. lyj-23 TaxID=2789283 RepID=UPI00397AF3CF
MPPLLALSSWLSSQEHFLLAEIAAAAAVIKLAIEFRGPVQRHGLGTFTVLAFLAAIAAPLDLLMIKAGTDRNAFDVGGLLLQSGLFIVFVGVLAWLAASWKMAALAEVGALLLIAWQLGSVSFNGISYFTAPFSTPVTDDSAIAVFTADAAAEVNLAVKFSPGDGVGTTLLTLNVALSGSADHCWGIILSGGARLTPDDGRDMDGITLTASSDGRQAILAAQDNPGWYYGTIIGSVQRRTASRSVVYLPPISAELPSPVDNSPWPGAAIPAARPKSLNLTVDCGRLNPLETVTQASPPLQVSNELAWQAQNELGPIVYATLDQGKEDRSRNVLFVDAILLGAAVACLVAALQAILKAAHKPE